MLKKISITLCLALLAIGAQAGNKIKVYFNHPVDTSVSTGENAVYLNNCLADTLVAYINRSHYSLDIAVYNYVQGSYASIATAINNAYNRGVQIRWIYDSSSSNSGLASINPAINTLSCPSSGSYGIMHCKFMVIDGNSTDPNDAIVWTGSTNWTSNQFNTDYNNTIIIQDSALAHAYIGEFNHMWGGSGLVPNLLLSKFGPYKSDLGRHSFTIEGKHVELYFSPSDGTNGKIQNTINTADKDLYFGMYAFTDNSDASLIMAKHSSGVYVAGIDDSYSNPYTPFTTFTAGLGSNFKVFSGTGLFHNKYMIVDQSDKCSDPIVLTGSHNWSIAADTKNDENTLIIHDDVVANKYYQSFRSNFIAFGGSLSTVHGCELGIPTNNNLTNDLTIYPNPSSGEFSIKYAVSTSQNVRIEMFNILGQKVIPDILNDLKEPGHYSQNVKLADPGHYLLVFNSGSHRIVRMICVSTK